MTATHPSSPTVVVTGANGLVGSRVVAALSERGATVRAVVRRAGTAPDLPGVEERVGDFADPAFAADVVAGADALVTTVHPLGRGRGRASARSGSTARSPSPGPRRRPGWSAWCTCRRPRSTTGGPGSATWTSTRALVPRRRRATTRWSSVTSTWRWPTVDGPTRVLLRPPAILGAGETSVWNTVRPAQVRDDERARHAVPGAVVRLGPRRRPGRARRRRGGRARSPPRTTRRPGRSRAGARPVNVASGPATQRDYLGAVTRRPRRGAGVGGRAGVDRADPRRPGTPLGLEPRGRPRRGAGRAGGRAEGLLAEGRRTRCHQTPEGSQAPVVGGAMRIFFTGGSGKAGKHVAPYLAEQGHQVTNADLVPLGHPDVADLQVDLTDAGETYSALAGLATFDELELAAKPTYDAVVHFAAVPRDPAHLGREDLRDERAQHLQRARGRDAARRPQGRSSRPRRRPTASASPRASGARSTCRSTRSTRRSRRTPTRCRRSRAR